jgi:hypothetical protein
MTWARENRGRDEARRLRQELVRVHRDCRAWRSRLRTTIAGQELVHSPGEAVAILRHAVCAEDATLHVLLKGTQPLFAHPAHMRTILRRQVGSGAFSRYMRDVFAAAEAYIENLEADSIGDTVDLSSVGLGKPTVGWVVRHFIVRELASALQSVTRSGPECIVHHDALRR